ncbi:MAG: phosphoethanolamine transferase [Burkholderiaceae bacterium]|nr:phosphoethanolamine transferase [Burkholderiaceae bacterium]
MRYFNHAPSIYIVFSYVLVSSIPFISFLFGKTVERSYQIIALEIFGWLTLWSLFKSPRWFHWLLLPAFLAIPIEIYLRIYFGQGISTHHLGVIVETSPKEALEFLGNKILLLLIVAIAILTWWYSILFAARRAHALDWKHKSRWATLLLLSIIASIWGYGEHKGISNAASTILVNKLEIGAKDESNASGVASAALPDTNARTFFMSGSASYNAFIQDIGSRLPKLPEWAKISLDNDALVRTWPFGLALRAADFLTERNYLSNLTEKSHAFQFKASQVSGSVIAQTIVVVIGESSRFDRWSINGYSRNTNPLLSQETNLVSFDDVVTAVAATRLSVPIIVSRKPATQSLKAGFSEKSFLSAFKEVGFKTFWLSNQMSFGEFDTPTSVFAKEADVTQFLNLGGFTDSSNFDQILLEPMQNAIHDPAPKKFIVLHSLGNHWNYSHRHPKEYDKWRPSLFGIVNPAYTDLKNKLALNNSYDNSILYTDWVLAQIIERLKKTDQITSMLYVSDHGQTLYDNSCNLAFHGHNTQYEFHIPVFMWFSDSYENRHPDKISQLYKHKKSKLSTENIFHSLLDMADIRYPDDRLEWSFLSSALKPHTRYVDSYGWSNYDDATFKGDCREVIDKKTPLVQEK